MQGSKRRQGVRRTRENKRRGGKRARGVRERERQLTLILITTIRSILGDLQRRRELFRGQQSAH